MTEHPDRRRLMRILAVILTLAWAAIAIAIASAYRPGGPVDVAVALACFVPVLVADAGVVWPPVGSTQRGHLALVWIWIAAILLAIPVFYGIALSLATDGPRSLVPSLEAAYGGALAIGAMAFFSTIGLVHARRRVRVFERRATWLSVGLTLVLTLLIGVAFLFVALVNDQARREQDLTSSRYGPTDPDRVPPLCDEPLALGPAARIIIEATSSVDGVDRGRAVLEGKRNGIDEAWGGSWSGPDGEGRQAYLRVGSQAWLNPDSDDTEAPGTTWQETRPDPFGLLGPRSLTMDGPPHAVAAVPRGTIVAEDLGLEVIEGARARRCRTFMDGPTALDTFLPLRWLLADGSSVPGGAIGRWRGEMDWWVFSDGELGLVSVEVSGSRGATGWQSEGVRAVLQARLSATDRDRELDVSVPFVATAASTPAPTPAGSPASTPAGSPSASAAPALGSAAP